MNSGRIESEIAEEQHQGELRMNVDTTQYGAIDWNILEAVNTTSPTTPFLKPMDDPCSEMPELLLPVAHVESSERKVNGSFEDSVIENNLLETFEPGRIKNSIRKIAYHTNNYHPSKLRKAKFSIKQHIKAYLYSKHN